MPALNVLANLFSNIYNSEMRNKRECLVIPSSNLATKVLETIQNSNYIGEFEQIDDNRGGKYRIQLVGKINRCGVISPRFPVKNQDYGPWERQYLPAVGIGILIVSTPNGVMSHVEAQNQNIGGRLIGYVY
ncbi:MAG: 30S ribosomal protein S8 [Thermoproteota archaeon]